MSAPVGHAVLSAKALLRRQFDLVHALLEASVQELAAEDSRRRPFGRAARAWACYAQGVVYEDLCINGVLAAGAPLALSQWAGRTGLSELPPLTGPMDWHAWGSRVDLEPIVVRPYARAVHAATDAYLARLPREALDAWHGEEHVCLLSALLLTLSMRRGEIAGILNGDPTMDTVEGQRF
jgi:hypothetical protein